MAQVTKKDLAAALHTQCGWPKARCAELLDDLAGFIGQALAQGDTVILPGLGKLSTTQTAERSGRNPHTGETITIPAGRRAKFSAAKALKERLS